VLTLWCDVPLSTVGSPGLGKLSAPFGLVFSFSAERTVVHQPGKHHVTFAGCRVSEWWHLSSEADMADDWLTAAFEEQRPHLRAVAYRLLGSMADADDAVQDTWLRLTGANTAAELTATRP
jgi:hypothetical protein